MASHIMISSNMNALMMVTLLLAGIIIGGASAQNCSCAAEECCSQFGYCGNTSSYCGAGCQSGPCWTATSSVPDIVTEEFFDGIIGNASDECPGKSFYTRSAFLSALTVSPQFGTDGTPDDVKREVAAFFAHATHETGYFCYIEEVDGASRDYCDQSSTQWPCAQGKGYHGRGPLQLHWNYNYGPAGNDLGDDLLTYPERLATYADVSFKASLWLWTDKAAHSAIVSGQGFGATIRAITSDLECDGNNADAMYARIGYYQDYCTQFGVDPGNNTSC